MNSKPLVAVAWTVFAAISTAVAQAPAAPVTAPPAATAPAPAATPPRLEMKPAVRAPRTTIVAADARNCLEFPSNLEIIKCAEKYLHRRAG